MEQIYLDTAKMLKAISDPKRLRIVDMLSCGELCSCKIQEAFQITQPTLSHDMKVLSDADSATYAYYQSSIKPQPGKPADPADGAVWRCKICGYEYKEKDGDPANGIAPGTKFEDLPEDWVCPLCKHPKSDFEKVQ